MGLAATGECGGPTGVNVNNLSSHEGGFDRCRVLVVDDDADVCRNVGAMLEGLGYLGRTVSSGRSALDEVKSARPDVILTDIYMPEFDGIELITSLRFAGSVIPIIAMIGRSSDRFDLLSAARALGAVAVLEKPFSQQDLALVIGAALHPVR